MSEFQDIKQLNDEAFKRLRKETGKDATPYDFPRLEEIKREIKAEQARDLGEVQKSRADEIRAELDAQAKNREDLLLIATYDAKLQEQLPPGTKLDDLSTEQIASLISPAPREEDSVQANIAAIEKKEQKIQAPQYSAEELKQRQAQRDAGLLGEDE